MNKIIDILTETLQIEEFKSQLNASSGLLGALPEFDSMAVLSVLSAIEKHFSITVYDDDISAEIFETIGSLSEFVRQKLSSRSVLSN